MSTGSAWLILFVAGLCEIGWAVGLTVLAMAISVALLGLGMRGLPVGTAYAVWTGIGAVGTAILGMFLFGESKEVARLVSIGLIVAGIAGLKLLTPDSH